MTFLKACVSFLSVFSVLCAVLLGVSRSSTAHERAPRTPTPYLSRCAGLPIRGFQRHVKRRHRQQ